MARKKSKRRLQEQLLAYILLFVCLPLFGILGVLAFLLQRNINDNIANGNAAIVRQTADKVAILMQSVNYSSSAFMLNKRTQTALATILKDPASYEAYAARYELMADLRYLSHSTLNEYQAEIAVLLKNMELIDSSGIRRLDPKVKDEAWYTNTLAGGSAPSWISQADGVFAASGSGQSLIMARTIFTYGKNTPGIILIRLPAEMLWLDVLHELPYSGTFSVMAHDGSIIVSTGSGKTMRGNGGGKEFRVTTDLGISGCSLIFSAKQGEVFALGRQITAVFFSVLALVVGAMIALVLQLSAKIAGPLKSLVEDISRLERGKLFVRSQKGFTEIDELSLCFNGALARIDALIEQVREESRLKEKHHFEALQAQIHPHFLFNTLNTIRWTALANKDEPVAALLADLGLMLTAAYNHADKMFPLKEEIRLLYAYVKIMRARFGDTFAFTVLSNDGAERLFIPKFLIQPLVENAILHGVRDLTGGEIRVRAQINGKNLEISVADNGQNTDFRKIENALQNAPERNEPYTRIGLGNVHTRIQMEFGGGYGLSLDRTAQSGCIIHLVIPCITEAELVKSINS